LFAPSDLIFFFAAWRDAKNQATVRVHPPNSSETWVLVGRRHHGTVPLIPLPYAQDFLGPALDLSCPRRVLLPPPLAIFPDGQDRVYFFPLPSRFDSSSTHNAALILGAGSPGQIESSHQTNLVEPCLSALISLGRAFFFPPPTHSAFPDGLGWCRLWFPILSACLRPPYPLAPLWITLLRCFAPPFFFFSRDKVLCPLGFPCFNPVRCVPLAPFSFHDPVPMSHFSVFFFPVCLASVPFRWPGEPHSALPP